MTKSNGNIPQFRYPGKPFKIDQQHIFFGRDKDIRQLYQLIKMESLVVLHSKSGLGQTSAEKTICPSLLALV